MIRSWAWNGSRLITYRFTQIKAILPLQIAYIWWALEYSCKFYIPEPGVAMWLVSFTPLTSFGCSPRFVRLVLRSSMRSGGITLLLTFALCFSMEIPTDGEPTPVWNSSKGFTFKCSIRNTWSQLSFNTNWESEVPYVSGRFKIVHPFSWRCVGWFRRIRWRGLSCMSKWNYHLFVVFSTENLKSMDEKPDQKVNHGEVGYFSSTILGVVLDSELPYFHLWATLLVMP